MPFQTQQTTKSFNKSTGFAHIPVLSLNQIYVILNIQGTKVKGKILLLIGGLHIPSAFALKISGVLLGGEYKGA